MDLIEYWGKNYSNDSYLEKNIKHLILNKLNFLSIANPSINDLRGVPLDALARLVAYNKKHKLALGDFENAFQAGINYLVKIENDVVRRVKERSEIRKNPLKKRIAE